MVKPLGSRQAGERLGAEAEIGLPGGLEDTGDRGDPHPVVRSDRHPLECEAAIREKAAPFGRRCTSGTRQPRSPTRADRPG